MTTIGNSPQAREMADESMVRNLAAQAEAIWPQELPIFERNPVAGRVLDVGSGTGEVLARLAKRFTAARFVGVDLEEAHLERARSRLARFGERIHLQRGDALALPFGDGEFDQVISRHLLQAVPDAERALAEMSRVLRPRGRLHVIAEDYGMLWCHPTSLGSDGLWQRLPAYGAAIGCDVHVGRKIFFYLSTLGFVDIKVDYVVVDTIRVPRETFARIWEAWRDGYTDSLVEHTKAPRAEIERRWGEMIDCVRDPAGYALWQVPVWTARKR